MGPVLKTNLQAHETREELECRLLLEKKKLNIASLILFLSAYVLFAIAPCEAPHTTQCI